MNKEKTNQTDLTNKFNELLKINDKLTVNTIQNINNRDLMKFTQKVFDSMVECNFSEIKVYCDLFEQINFIIDDYIEDNQEISTAFYNIFVLSFLSEAVQAFSEIHGQQNNYRMLLKQETYSKIIKALYKNGQLTQKELANAVDLKTQNLANYLAKIRNENVFICYSSPKYNSKNVYYALAASCKKYLEKELQRRRTVNERFEYGDYELNFCVIARPSLLTPNEKIADIPKRKKYNLEEKICYKPAKQNYGAETYLRSLSRVFLPKKQLSEETI